ncbi:MAG TPA: hypothetical protein VLF14_01730 [Candidatus Binatia bacterium]|nr:hypothetical protein [Candidatus Binatia bacterium]
MCVSAGDRDPNSLLQVDFILPEQLENDAVANRTGEFGLLWAVFTDGIQTYCREILRGSTTSLAYREVERWIFRPNSDAVTSFSSLCELFGIDARRMRRALIRFRENPSEGILNLLSVHVA